MFDFFVAGLYQNVLDRAPENNAALDFWSEHLRSRGGLTTNSIQWISSCFFDSQEFKCKTLSAEARIEKTYQGILSRDAEDGACSFWKPHMERNGFDWMRQQFYGSVEFQGIAGRVARSAFSVSNVSDPLIAKDPSNKYGLEGGQVVKVGDTLHYFGSEMYADGLWEKMRIAHYLSHDNGQSWDRLMTVTQSIGEPGGKSPFNSVWANSIQFDAEDNHWNLYYVGYKLNGYDGHIVRARSMVAGIDGINAPFVNMESLMDSSDAAAWEGDQGVSSFYPYQVGCEEYALYGSHQYNTTDWEVGLAKKINGEWVRQSELALPVGAKVENPIVSRINGEFIAVYDDLGRPDTIGLLSSKDGINWKQEAAIVILNAASFTSDVRTPVGVIDGKIYFTSRDLDGMHWSLRSADISKTST